MFLRSLFDRRSNAPVIDMEPIQTGTVTFEWAIGPVSSPAVCHPPAATEGTDSTQPPSPPEQSAAMRSDAQQSETLQEFLGLKPEIPINDLTSAQKESRALSIVRNSPDWMTQNDRELAVIFHVHPSTVSRWRKSWVEAGVVEVKTVKRRKWMRAL